MPREFDLDWRQVPITYGTDGLYHGKITVGRTVSGRLDRRHRCGRTVKEVEEKLRALVKEIEAGRKLKPGRAPTVEEWFTTWLTDIAPFGRRALKPRSLADYWSKTRNWIIPHLGAHRLGDLEPEHVDALHATMRRAKKAESHILKVHAILRRGLSVAMVRDKVGRNVAEMVDPPSAGAPLRTPLERDVARRIIEVAGRRRNGARWMVGLSVGPRQGEALGLCWRCVDLDEGTVEIAWQLQRLPWAHGCADPHRCGGARHRFKACPAANRGQRKGRCQRHPGAKGCPAPCPRDCTKHAASCPARRSGGLVLARPKTWREGADPRIVALPAQVIAVLLEHRDAQRRERRRAGTAWRRFPHPDGGDADLVFRQVDGWPIDPRRDWQEWQEIQVEAGVDPGRVHGMRHTAATTLLELGVDLAVVQEVLGHADVRTTRGYQKVRTAATRQAAKRMGGILFQPPTVTDLVTERRKRRAG